MARGRTKEKERKIADFWQRLIAKGKEAQATYRKAARKVEKYLGPVHKDLKDRKDIETHFMELDTILSVPKIAQMRNSLGPRLYPAKPVRNLNSVSGDPVMVALAAVLEAYGNYTARESKLSKQQRRAIDEAIIYGRGCMVQTYIPERGLVTSKHLSSLDLVFDPDFPELEEARWIAYKTTEPLRETKRRISKRQSWRLKGLSKPREGEEVKGSAELVEYWTVLSKMGLGIPSLDESRQSDFVRLEIVEDHEFPLFVGDWEVPFYLDHDWPLSYWDPIEPLGRPWPDNIAGQVLPSQQAIDLLTSARLEAAKNRDRLIVFTDASVLDRTATERFRSGGAATMIPVCLDAGRTLQDSLYVPNFGEGSRTADVERAYHESQIETTTGVNELLTGEALSGPKDRSATASQIRAQGVGARLADLQQKVQEFTTDAARKEAIIARLVLSEEDVEPVVPVDAIGMFYLRVETPGGGVLPVRDPRPFSERDPQEQAPLSLEYISPRFSTFFVSEELAFGALVELWEELQQTTDPRVLKLVTYLQSRPLDEIGLPDALGIDPVTAAVVWEATAGMSPAELMKEFSYEVATASVGNYNRPAQQANADFLVQNVLPLALQAGDVDTANKVLALRDEAYEVPPDQRIQIAPPPPPPPQEA